MAIIIIGGAGFIGSKLTRRFLDAGDRALVIDNLCRGRKEFIDTPPGKERPEFVHADASDARALRRVMAEYHARHPVDMVWHMAANSDIPAGIADASVDLRDTFMTTHAALEAMKQLGLKKLAFASSSAVYGDHGPDLPLREDTGPLLPISNYGAMKLASEALISAAAENYLEHAWIFRFPNVVGIPATHGVILDFIRKLKATPGRLEVLGNGTQQKAYLHVDELVEAMLFIADRDNGKRNLYNIGPDDAGCRVADIAAAVAERVSPGARVLFGTEGRGWVGDVPKFRYSVAKAAALGWKPRFSSLDAVRRAVDEIARQEEAAS
ncbi:MAG: NAD-dependent epimerase/dehydratase family protein [Desulfovibrio sp.]|jgi:UDP-glucose 4-epimerase|nr:NAD-dependent epimerase/dehydratase family protein [Desulfovibrio sp.]